MRESRRRRKDLRKIARIAFSLVIVALFITPLNPIIKPAKAGLNWEQVAPLPNADVGYAESYNGMIYMIGQWVQVYDPVPDSWIVKGPASIGYRGGSAIIGDRIYIVDSFGDAQYYNITTDAFADLPNPPTLRRDYSVAENDGIIYVLGGWFDGAATSADVVEAYNPANNTWWSIAPMIVPRKNHQAVGLNGYVYAIGGLTGAGFGNPTITAERYDPTTNTWDLVAPPADDRRSFGATAHQGTIVVGNGRPSGSISTEVYIPEADLWFTGPNIPESNYFDAPMTSLGDFVYSIGGRTAANDLYNTTYRWDGVDNLAPSVSVSDAPDPQLTGGVVWFNATITDNGGVIDVWIHITDPIGSPVGNFSMVYNPSTGQWEYNRTFMDIGNYNYIVWANDTSDNWGSASGTFNIIMPDTTPPMITNLQPLDGSTTNDNTPTIGANYSDSSGIDVNSILLKVDSANETSNATVTATGIAYTPTSSLSDGSHTVYLEVEDIFDNVATESWSFNIDTTSPIITNLQPPNGAIMRDGTPTIGANYSDSSGINVSSVLLKINDIDETSNATIIASGAKLHNRIFFEGNYSIYLEVKDNAGNLVAETWSFVIDFTPPTITNLQPPSASELTDNPPVISADYYDTNGINVSSVLLKVDGTDVTLDSIVTANNVSYLPSSIYVDGVHIIGLEVRDIAGNLNTQNWAFIVDATPPKIINKQPTNASTINNNKPEISANFSNPLDINVSSILLRVDSVNVTAETIVTVEGVYYIPGIELVNGTHTIYLEQRSNW
jgi:hypothetical protein